MDVRDGTTGDSPRLFCIEGDIEVKRKIIEHPWLRRMREQTMLNSFSAWWE